MSIINISSNNTVTIPEMMLSKVGVKAGQEVMISEREGGILLIPLPADPIAYLCGVLMGGATLTRELVAERASEIECE